MEPLYRLILGMLCVWRFTHLLHGEDGPWSIIVRIRKAAGSGFWGGLLDCFCCLSLWMSIPFAWGLGRTTAERFLLWPALSAGAILIERITDRESETIPPPRIDELEVDHVLRQ